MTQQSSNLARRASLLPGINTNLRPMQYPLISDYVAAIRGAKENLDELVT